MNLALILFIGVATMYGGPLDGWRHDGNPLYCDRYDGRSHIFADGAPWVAVDEAHYRSGRVRCGDEMWLYLPGGQVLRAVALDAGYLERHYVAQWGSDRPIVADVPYLFWPEPGISAPVRMVNVSAARRILEERAGR